MQTFARLIRLITSGSSKSSLIFLLEISESREEKAGYLTQKKYPAGIAINGSEIEKMTSATAEAFPSVTSEFNKSKNLSKYFSAPSTHFCDRQNTFAMCLLSSYFFSKR